MDNHYMHIYLRFIRYAKIFVAVALAVGINCGAGVAFAVAATATANETTITSSTTANNNSGNTGNNPTTLNNATTASDPTNTSTSTNTSNPAGTSNNEQSDSNKGDNKMVGMRDPTAPSTPSTGRAVYGDQLQETNPYGIKIDGIIFSKNRKVVTIDGQYLQAGDKIDQILILDIYPDSIKVRDLANNDNPQNEVIIKMSSYPEIKSAVRPTTIKITTINATNATKTSQPDQDISNFNKLQK
jgi:hypothetical protein